MIIYTRADVYITSKKTLKDQLAAIDNIISVLMATAATAAVDENLTEYILDDGQTKIQCNYRGIESIVKSIQSLEKLKNFYSNQLNGRMIRLVDSKNLTRYPYTNGRF